MGGAYCRTLTVAEPTRRTRNVRGEARRQELLDAALRVVGRDGVAAVTHRAVAAEADAPVGLLTYYFGSIDGLLEAALSSFVEREIERVTALTEALGETPDVQLAETVAEGTLAAFRAQGVAQVGQFELYATAARRAELQAAARQCIDAYVALAESVLVRLGAEKPNEGARALVAIIDGFTLHRLAAGADEAFDHDVAVPAIMAVVGAYATVPV